MPDDLQGLRREIRSRTPKDEFDDFEDDDQSCDCQTTWPDVAIVFIQAAFFLLLFWICAGTPGWGK